MDFESISAIIFILALGIFLYRYRKYVCVQKILYPVVYIIMLRTKVGIEAMDKAAQRYRRFLVYAGYTAVVVGFIGMGIIAFSLLDNLYKMLFIPAAAPGVGIVQPFSRNIPGTFFVPFFYFIISIFILVIVHEFSHGVMARVYGLKIKSSGLAVLSIIAPILPAAFVEPDEKKLVKRPYREQLSIFAAGPFANIVTAVIMLLLIGFAVNPVVAKVVDYDGVVVTGLMKDHGSMIFPAEKAGMQKGEIIREIDGISILTVENFTKSLDKKLIGETISLKTNRTGYMVKLAENPLQPESKKPYLGVFVMQKTKIKESFSSRYSKITADFILWFAGLFLWLYILNLGIGLFNLVPIPVCDGGRMLQIALMRFMSQEKADKIWKNVGVFFIALILINLVLGFVK